jgi:hypothetical protein
MPKPFPYLPTLATLGQPSLEDRVNQVSQVESTAQYSDRVGSRYAAASYIGKVRVLRYAARSRFEKRRRAERQGVEDEGEVTAQQSEI